VPARRAVEHAELAQRRQVLRGAAGVEVQPGLQLADGHLLVLAEQLEDADPHRVSEHAENCAVRT
jgi:hypothetical protein